MSARSPALAEPAMDRLLPVSLEAGIGLAELQTRTDRKYVVRPEHLLALTDTAGEGLAVLEIDGARAFRYQSVYFDTPTLDSYHDAAYGRRRRFKVRTRTYLDSATTVLEVKAQSGRGETVKYRMPYDIADRDRLTAHGRAFVGTHVGDVDVCHLAPVLTTSYRRTTYVDLAVGIRLTSDAGLVCTAVDGRSVALPRPRVGGDEVARRGQPPTDCSGGPAIVR